MMSRYFLFVFLFIFSIPSFAQDVNWVLAGGGWTEDYAEATAMDSEGNCLFAGYLEDFDGIFNDTLTFDYQGIIITKMSPEGELLWTQSFGDGAQLEVRGIVVDDEDNVFVMGEHYYSVDGNGFSVPGNTNSDISDKTYLLKFSASGAPIWAKGFRPDDTSSVNQSGDFLAASIEIFNNDIFLTGSFNNPITLNGQTYEPNSSGSFNQETTFLMRLDNAGDVIWFSTGSVEVNDIAVDESSIYLSGSSFASNSTFGGVDFSHPNSTNSVNAFIIKYGLDGMPVFVKNFPSDWASAFNSLALTDSGELFAKYRSREPLGGFEYNLHNKIYKFDVDGNLVFTLDLDTEPEVHNSIYVSRPVDLATIGNQLILVGGFRDDVNIPPFSFNSVTKDPFVMRINDIGYPQWAKTFPSEEHDFLFSVGTFEDKIFVAGDYQSDALMLGDFLIENNSGNNDVDIFMMQISDTTSNSCPPNSFFELTFTEEILCENESVEISISGQYAHYIDWYRDATLLESGLEKNIEIGVPGNYYAKINQTTSCPSISDTIRVDFLSDVNALTDITILPTNEVSLGADTLVCASPIYQLNTTISPAGIVSYNWNTGSEESSISIPSTGIYHVEVENEHGCKNRDTIQIEIKPNPVVNLGTDLLVESFETIILDGGNFSDSVSYLWNDGSTERFRSVNGINLPQGQTEFSVQVTDTLGCSGFDEVNLCICSTIEAFVFYDSNNNGVQDLDEALLPNIPINFSPGAFELQNSSPTGATFFAEYGNYDLAVIVDDNWIATTDSIQTIVLDATNPYDTAFFGIAPFIEIREVTSLINSSPNRCNESVSFDIWAKNSGTNIVDGVLWMEIDETIEAVNFIDVADTIVNLHKVGWFFEDLFPEYSFHKTIEIEIPGVPTVFPGDTLSYVSFASIENGNQIEDSEPYNYDIEVTCAYDPNDKLVHPTYGGNYTYLGEALIYTIRFQNTGNDVAYNVTIRDTLHQSLEVSSFELLSTSHVENLTTVLEEDKYLTFYFNDIFLPDSTSNFEGSQGYVSFKIRPQEGLPVGTEITNRAGIYFDQNPPIITNTAINILVDEIPTCEITSNGFSNLICNNNGTESDSSDDFLTFDLMPQGQGLFDSYEVESSSSVSPSIGNFEETTNFSIPAGQGDIEIILIDNLNTTCPDTLIIQDIGTCSEVCQINIGQTDFSVSCNDNGTLTDASDDYIEFELIPTGNNLGLSYYVMPFMGTVAPDMGEYGVITSFSTNSGSAGNGDFQISIEDVDSPDCVQELFIEDPGTCSFTNTIDELVSTPSVNISPNPFDDLVSIQPLNFSKDYSLKISDSLGRVLLSKTISGKATIDLSQYPNGVFWFIFNLEKETIIKPIVKK